MDVLPQPEVLSELVSLFDMLENPGLAADHMFSLHDRQQREALSAKQVQTIHSQIRQGSISLAQTVAAIQYTCLHGDNVEPSELIDVLKEMDRRYFLLRDLRWEFSMLSGPAKDTVPETQARWLMESMHGDMFSHRKWEEFTSSRPSPGSEVSLQEVEVELCSIPSRGEVRDEKQRDDRDRAGRRARELEEREREEQEARRRARQAQEEEERLRTLREDEEEAAKRNREESVRFEADEAERKAEDAEAARLAALAQEREQELRREEERYGDADKRAAEAAEAEKEAESALRHAKNDEEAKKAKARLREKKHTRIRQDLKAAIKSRDKYRLKPAIREFEEEKLEDADMDLAKARRILNEIHAKEGLKEAMTKRQLDELEQALGYVKKNGFEPQLAHQVLEANKLLSQLRRLERIRHEILELKQSTVAEIRSYQKPPAAVHTVMIATFLLFGHKEKETKVWKAVQALVGKTGKEALKRRCLDLKAERIEGSTARRAAKMLEKLDLDEIRDVSAGAATFYCWASSMIEESMALQAAKKAKAAEEESAETIVATE